MLDMGALGILVVWFGLAVVGPIGMVWWMWRAWKTRGGVAARTKIVGGVVGAAGVLGGLGTVIGLVKAFGAVGGESVDPSQKARILAEGISEAINFTAIGFTVWLASVLILVFLTRKRGAKPEGES